MKRGSFIGHSCAVGQAMSLILASVVVSATGASMALMYASSERDLLAQEDAAREALLENDAEKVMDWVLYAAVEGEKLVALQLDGSRAGGGDFASSFRDREYGSSVTDSDTLDTSGAQENATATAWWASGAARENASTAKDEGEGAACGSVQCQGVGGAEPVESDPTGSDEASREVQRWDYNPNFREWGYRLMTDPTGYDLKRLDLSNVRVAYIGQLPPETAKAGEEAVDDAMYQGDGVASKVENRTSAGDGDGSDPASGVGGVDPGVGEPDAPGAGSQLVGEEETPPLVVEGPDAEDVGPDGFDPHVMDSGRRINQWEADILVAAGFDFIPRHHASTEADSERKVEEGEAAVGSQATDGADSEAQAWQDAAGTGTSVGAGKVVHDEEDVSVDAENDVTGEESDVRDGDVFPDTRDSLTDLFLADELDHYQVIVVGSDVNMSLLDSIKFKDELAWWLHEGGILLVMPSWNTDYGFLDTFQLVNDLEATPVAEYQGRTCDEDRRLARTDGGDSYCIHGENWSVPTSTKPGSSKLLRDRYYQFDFNGFGPRQTWSMDSDWRLKFETVMSHDGEPVFLFSKASYKDRGEPHTLKFPYDNGRIILSGYSLGLLPQGEAVQLMKSLMLHRSIPMYKTAFGFETPEFTDIATSMRSIQVDDDIVGDVAMQVKLFVWHGVEGQRIYREPLLAPQLPDEPGEVQTASNLAQQAASDAQKDPGSVSPK